MLGFFDSSAVVVGWFDETAQPLGWFDADFLDTVEAQAEELVSSSVQPVEAVERKKKTGTTHIEVPILVAQRIQQEDAMVLKVIEAFLEQRTIERVAA